MQSRHCSDITSSPTDAATPRTVSAERCGQRTMLRRMMRVGWSSHRTTRDDASRPRRNTRRRGRLHRLRRGQGRSAAHHGGGAGERRHRAQARRDREGARTRAVYEQRKAEYLGVLHGIDAAEPAAERESERRSHGSDAEHQLRVVQSDLPIAVAEGLEQADVRALGRDQAPQDHVGQEGRDQQEDRRQHPRNGRQLLDLVHHKPVRELVGAGDSTDAAVALEDPVELLDHRIGIDAARELQRHVIEGFLEIEGRRQRVAVHPQHTEAPVVGHQRSRPEAVDELRR